MFRKVLIANRGEIAVRVIRACRDIGIKTAVIYSDADKTLLHTRLADKAYHLEGSLSSETYLNKSKIIDLAKEIGADAIHPGYGFFSENADFIEECEKEGITFIGPSSASVKMMGNKTEARKLMQKNNVPIVPGTTEPVINIDEGIRAAKEIGFPVLLKASAGGGGKGMRKVNSESEFESSFEGAQREAVKSFANGAIYIEKYIEQPKHIEVQIIADTYGNYIHLFERECSIQRRHQKIIEEAPSIFLDEKTRELITAAAINAAKACGYYNAGTIEFLMDKDKNFYFLEMNTRLQVEHPVTELITVVDLVVEQLSIAAGNKLSFSQDKINIKGHAIECRIYAEDATNNFLPSTGKILQYSPPGGPGIRVDSGFELGSEISMYYDPLIAKLVCRGHSRKNAVQRMKRALSEFKISGITTNIPFLRGIFEDEDFQRGIFTINFVEEKIHGLLAAEKSSDYHAAAAAFTAVIKSLKKSKSFSKSDNNKWTDKQHE